MAKNNKKPLEVETLAHKEARRRNIPTAEFESVMREEEKTPIRLAYERRNRDLDPSSSGAARMSRTGPTSWSPRRRSTSRKRFTRRS
jgi:hypothetical protein